MIDRLEYARLADESRFEVAMVTVAIAPDPARRS